jgi:hypothetical protein
MESVRTGFIQTKEACCSVLHATMTSLVSMGQVLGNTLCIVMHTAATMIANWAAVVVLLLSATSLFYVNTREVSSRSFAKADKYCHDVWLDESDISPHCVLKPNDVVCRWRRMAEYKATDYLVPLGNIGLDEYLLNNTNSEEVKCDIWYRTNEREWKAMSPTAYHQQACKCRFVEEPPHFIINVLRLLMRNIYDAGKCFLYAIGAGIVMISSVAVAWVCRRYKRGNCVLPSPMHCNWKFNRSKYDSKVGQHGHPFLNTYRSSRRSGLLNMLTKLGKVVNLFGCADDAKGVPLANKILSVQTVTSYNISRTNQDGAQLYDTYDATIDAAVAAHTHKYILCYDSAWYLTPDQIVRLVQGNRVLIFNMKTTGYGNHHIRDPLSGKVESQVINDGIHYKEKVAHGDQYCHRACVFPHRDSFCLEHKGEYVYFSKVKMIHDGDEDLTSVAGYECVYRAQSINLKYSDGKMVDYFGESGTKTALLFDHTYRATGAVIPALVNGKHVVRKLTEDEFKVCLSCLTLPNTAGFTLAAKNKINLHGYGTEREHLMEVVHMLRHREAFDDFVPVYEGLVGYAWNVVYLWFAMLLRTMVGKTWFGRGVVHIDSSRWYTEDAMMERAHGQNSQEAGTQADGPSGGSASGLTDSGGSPRGPNGTGQSKEKASETKTTKNGTAGQAKKANSGVRFAPEGGAQAAPNKGNGPKGAQGKAQQAAAGKSGKTSARSRKRNGVGKQTRGSGVAGEASTGSSAETGGNNAQGEPGGPEPAGIPNPGIPSNPNEEDFSEIRSADDDTDLEHLGKRRRRSPKVARRRSGPRTHL